MINKLLSSIYTFFRSHVSLDQLSRWRWQLIDFGRKRPLLAAANLLFLLVNLALLLQPQLMELAMPPAPKRVEVAETQPRPAEPADTGKMVEGKLWSGASFDALLQKAGLPANQIQQVLDAARKVFDPRKMRAGNPYRLKLSETGDLQKLRYDIDTDRYLQIEKGPNGWTPAIQKNPLESRTEAISVPIEDNLFNALQQAGEKDTLAMALADIFQWDVDFNTDFRRGDQFRVLVEKYYLDQELVRYGNVLTAEFSNQGKKIQAFLHTVPGRKAEYYDAAGRPLRKQMLKSPLPFLAPITSRFSRNRFHPILKRYRPHLGVDYGAPAGTPVLSMADGRVVAKSWDGKGGGNMIRISHAGGMTTTYMHLSRYAAGMSIGKSVNQGQVIGYVGATGLASGPHLDFRIQKGKQYVNPVHVHGTPSDPLPASQMASFHKVRDSLMQQLNFGPQPAPATPAVAVATAR